jgi:signal transduction histidine kinase
VKSKLYSLLIFALLSGQILAQSKKSIDSLRANLKEIEKNDTTFFTVNSTFFVDYYFKVNIDSAIYFIQKSIDIAKRRKWAESEVQLMNQLAFAYQQKGLIYKSVDLNYKALILAKKLNKPHLTTYINRVLGTSYYDLKKYDKARELLNSAYQLALKYTDHYEQLATLNALGNLAIETADYKMAEQFYRKTIAVADELNDNHSKAIAFHNLAHALSLQNRFNEALPLFEESIKMHTQEKATNSLSSVYVDLASHYFRQNKYEKSLASGNIAFELGQKGGSDEFLTNSLYWKYKNLQALNRHKEALVAFENYIKQKELSTQEEVDKRIKSLQLEYDLSQKETEILSKNLDLVKKENQNLSLQKNRTFLILLVLLMLSVAGFLFYNRFKLRNLNAVLDTKVRERTTELENANEVLIRKNEEISQALFKGQTIERKRVAVELHDNLSGLLSAIKMSFAAINTKNYTEKEKEIYLGLKDMMNNAYTEVRNISHNIMPEELERIGLQATIDNLIKKLNTSNQIQFTFCDLVKKRLDSKFELNLYSITLEIINNIIKHSKATSAKITLEAVNDSVRLKAKDNGIGVGNEITNGQGMKNMKTRVQALNGDMDIKAENQTGTEIIITIPV